MQRTSYDFEISLIAGDHHLNPTLVESLILVESGGRADAFRFEPKFWDKYLKSKEPWAKQVPRRVASSYGLMQIMYVTAWEAGYRGQPEGLFVPVVNLEWGCRHLAKLKAWAKGDLASTLAAYNGGKRGNEPGTAPLRNAAYADKVLTLYEAQRPHPEERRSLPA